MRFEQPAHTKIIGILEDGGAHHKSEFEKLMSYDGLRGRISELNKWGYVIRRVDNKGNPLDNGEFFKCITIPIRESFNELISIPLKPVDNRVEIVPLGDTHYGNPCFSEESERKLEGYIDYIANTPGVYTILMGDLIESANERATFKLKLSPQEQYEWVLKKLEPLIIKKKIIAILSGNHENWIFVDKGFDIIKTMSMAMGVPYLGDSGYIGLKVGKQFYSVYAIHPKSGNIQKSSKIKLLEDLGSIHDVDIILCGHMHSIITEEQIKRKPNFITGNIEDKKQLLISTGAFLEYGDYAEQSRYKPEKMGAPKIKLYADKFDMHMGK
jgi:hypothetical protein